MEVIRMGLVGFGGWPQQAYAPLLKELPGVRVVSVAASSEETLSLARKTFGDGIAATSDYRQLFEAGDVDALMIALPNALHAEALLAAAESNKHVFFEPPIATDPETAKHVLETLKQRSEIVQADLELRCLPVLEAIHAQISGGILGSPRGKDLYKRLSQMGDHLAKVGKSLEGATKAYNSAIASLEGRVLVTARKFDDLHVTVSGEDLEALAPVEQTPRALQAPEMLLHTDPDKTPDEP